MGVPKTLEVDTFPDSVSNFGASSGHFGFCRRWGIAVVERLPPASLGWYLEHYQTVVVGKHL